MKLVNEAFNILISRSVSTKTYKGAGAHCSDSIFVCFIKLECVIFENLDAHYKKENTEYTSINSKK